MKKLKSFSNFILEQVSYQKLEEFNKKLDKKTFQFSKFIFEFKKAKFIPNSPRMKEGVYSQPNYDTIKDLMEDGNNYDVKNEPNFSLVMEFEFDRDTSGYDVQGVSNAYVVINGYGIGEGKKFKIIFPDRFYYVNDKNSELLEKLPNNGSRIKKVIEKLIKQHEIIKDIERKAEEADYSLNNKSEPLRVA